MNRRKIAGSIAGVVALAGAGAGLAAAQGGAGDPAPAVAPPVEAHRTDSAPLVQRAPTEQRAGTGTGTDTLQSEDRNGPGATDNPEAEEQLDGKEGNVAEEPGDEQLPGGGHADPPGQDTDHQFEGTE